MQIEGCGTWNQLLLECNPGQFSFILHAASDTLSMVVNMQIAALAHSL